MESDTNIDNGSVGNNEIKSKQIRVCKREPIDKHLLKLVKRTNGFFHLTSKYSKIQKDTKLPLRIWNYNFMSNLS